MRLTRYTDYALRVLMHLAIKPDRLASIGEMARAYRISQNHLMKVVHDLRKNGFVEAVRGRRGGIRLARPPAAINVGDVIRHTEDELQLLDCGACAIAPACGLSGVVGEAMRAFMAVLDGYTLADLVKGRGDMIEQLIARAPSAPPDLDIADLAIPAGAGWPE